MENRSLFEDATATYTQAMQIIDKMMPIVLYAFKDYSPETPKRQFDIILQSLLYDVALADKQLDSEELDFIRNIVKHNDIIDAANSFLAGQLDSELNWNIIFIASLMNASEQLENFSNLFHAVIEEEIQDFVSKYAVVDAMSEDSGYGTALFNCMAKIGAKLCIIDNDLQQSEKDTVFEFLKPFIALWEVTKHEATVALEEDSSDDGENLEGTPFLGGKR